MCVLVARVADEGQVPEPEHVERGESCGEDADRPERFAQRALLEGRGENRVFREETGQTRKAGDGEDRRGHRPEGDGDFFAQAAHLAQVLLAAKRVNCRARAKKEQRLEEGVRHQVKDGGRVSRDSAA